MRVVCVWVCLKGVSGGCDDSGVKGCFREFRGLGCFRVWGFRVSGHGYAQIGRNRPMLARVWSDLGQASSTKFRPKSHRFRPFGPKGGLADVWPTLAGVCWLWSIYTEFGPTSHKIWDKFGQFWQMTHTRNTLNILRQPTPREKTNPTNPKNPKTAKPRNLVAQRNV